MASLKMQNLMKVFIKHLTEEESPVITNVLNPVEDRWLVVYERSNCVRCAIFIKDGSGFVICKSDMIVK